MSRKPKCQTARPADSYARAGERIMEFSSENGGGLISLRTMPDGTLVVEVYRTDPTVIVWAGGQQVENLRAELADVIRERDEIAAERDELDAQLNRPT